MGKGKPGVMMYWEMFDTLNKVKPEKIKTMLAAIRNFAQYGEVPDFNDDEALELVWPLIEQKLAADHEKYERIKEQRTNAINARWEKERAKATEEYERIQMNTPVYETERNIPTSTPTSSTTATSTATSTGARTTPASGNLPTHAPSTFGRYNNVFLSEGELAELKAEYPGKWEAMIENLSAKIAMKGYRYENHLAALRIWEQQDGEKDRQTARNKPLYQRMDMCDGITIDDYKNDIPLPL